MKPRARAYDLLKSAGLSSSLPVDVTGAAASVGLVVRVVDRSPGHALTHSEEISGALDFATGVIWVAGWESSSRIRYTIAHEIGHEVLGHEHDLQNHSRLHELEDEADEFASELLMPEKHIQSALTRHGGPLVPVLAQEFDVSIRAMERRLARALPPVSESEWRG